MSKIVTRFAPSPTGYLHVGGARTAVFAWLLARHADGKFILRIEDTDRERSTPEATQAILDGMEWLGLDHDELFYQGERAVIHSAAVDELIEKGEAYYCECSAEKVQEMRDKAMKEGRKPKYDGTCREKNLGPGEGRVVRLKAPQTGFTAFDDMVKGPISINNEEMDDLILRRGDGSPTYNLAVVVDDSDMGVTHVLRGDDHVNNTPRQIMIYKALGKDVPVFGHVPMILGTDKKKLSKRHGAVSVMEYFEQGYLSEAMLNYLLRLGWSHGDQEIFSREEMVKLFDTKNLGSSPSVFDPEKLGWLNSQYIKERQPSELVELLTHYIEKAGLPKPDAAYLETIIPVLQPRAKTLVEMAAGADVFLLPCADLEFDEKAVVKFLGEEGKAHAKALRDILADLPEFTKEAMEPLFQQYLADNELKFKAIGQPVRVALTGRTQSPGGLYDLLAILGKEESLARFDRALSL